MKKQKFRTTISLSEREWQHARRRMVDADWDRAGDKQGISRYVQELILADMRGEPFVPPRPLPPVEPLPHAGRPKRARN